MIEDLGCPATSTGCRGSSLLAWDAIHVGSPNVLEDARAVQDHFGGIDVDLPRGCVLHLDHPPSAIFVPLCSNDPVVELCVFVQPVLLSPLAIEIPYLFRSGITVSQLLSHPTCRQALIYLLTPSTTPGSLPMGSCTNARGYHTSNQGNGTQAMCHRRRHSSHK